ncbi:anthranilate synthase component II [Halosegnis longus]|uniref:Anthranilate synthase component II n=1 Tax=Halosegnis longus TaxID=2216012 RepID=A0AAJ4RAH1_9EURY|nr:MULTISPECIES: aminodeoxychorismate/anthranilate synthase component II [Halobacteriales]RNJ27483.1 aminodeoxychorismate/anthranilate synthase component II [Salella cibi]
MNEQNPILVIDNYDSFAYNLVQYVGEALLAEGLTNEQARDTIEVRRNDAVTTSDIDRMTPRAVVVSPGPGTPQQAGVSLPIFRDLAYPTLGVCLGHQALCAANGVPVGQADEVVHGKPSVVSHDGRGVFADLPDELHVGRYHSLAVERADLTDALTETARTEDERGVVMGVRHADRPHVGVQFHPESILTDHGRQMVRSFLATASRRD